MTPAVEYALACDMLKGSFRGMVKVVQTILFPRRPTQYWTRRMAIHRLKVRLLSWHWSCHYLAHPPTKWSTHARTLYLKIRRVQFDHVALLCLLLFTSTRRVFGRTVDGHMPYHLHFATTQKNNSTLVASACESNSTWHALASTRNREPVGGRASIHIPTGLIVSVG